jgi:hypothetical protein
LTSSLKNTPTVANNAASSGREHLIFQDNNLQGVWKLTPQLDALTGLKGDDIIDGLCLAAGSQTGKLRALQMHQTILHFIFGATPDCRNGVQLNLPCLTTPERGGWA